MNENGKIVILTQNEGCEDVEACGSDVENVKSVSRFGLSWRGAVHRAGRLKGSAVLGAKHWKFFHTKAFQLCFIPTKNFLHHLDAVYTHTGAYPRSFVLKDQTGIITA